MIERILLKSIRRIGEQISGLFLISIAGKSMGPGPLFTDRASIADSISAKVTSWE